MMNSLIGCVLLMVHSLLQLCSDDIGGGAQMKVTIKHSFGDRTFALDQEYETLTGRKVTLTRFKYYLSNIELIRKDGSSWKQDRSYHLIEINDESSNEAQLLLTGVPEGEYVRISFSIGVDSAANHSGEQDGFLDPDHGMFWMWETGYVFFKIEGFFQDGSQKKGAMVYHVGRDVCLRTVRLDLPPMQRKLGQGVNSTLEIVADIRKVFGGFPGSAIDLTPGSNQASVSVMGGEKAPKAATNFAQIFSIKDKN